MHSKRVRREEKERSVFQKNEEKGETKECISTE